MDRKGKVLAISMPGNMPIAAAALMQADPVSRKNENGARKEVKRVYKEL